MKSFFLALCISTGFAGVGAAQSGAPGPQGGNAVNHGVSEQYERGDQFPVYATHLIHVGNGTPYYDPQEITIGVGDVIRWVNKPLSDTHTVFDISGRFGSSAIPAGADWCYHFTREGDYDYTCRFHPWMKGVVHVRKREVSLRPVALPASGAASGDLAQRAFFLLTNREAVESSPGIFWVSGVRPGTVERRDVIRNSAEVVRIGNVATKLVPLFASGGHLVLATSGRLMAVDTALNAIVDQIALPGRVTVVRAVVFSSDRWWAATANGILSVDTAKKTVRPRTLPSGARITCLRQSGTGEVWALDAGRRVLLRLGSEWITEVPLPADVRDPGGIAIGHDSDVWFADAHSGLVGVVHPGGVAEEFASHEMEHPELLQVAGSRDVPTRGRGQQTHRRIDCRREWRRPVGSTD